MLLYNTLSRKKEEIQPIEAGHFKMYSCGPTVYRYIHIGNLRTFTMADWLRRTLLYQGHRVTHIKNITDVGHMRVELLDQGEDKLISQARKEGKSSAEIAAFYTAAFHDDETKLNILPAQVFPQATQHIPEMLEIVKKLLEKGVAYEVEGDIFFDIKAFPDYGKLSGNLLDGLMAGARDTADVRRRNPEDFPLWKKAEPNREMAWDSPWGRGFPGWHIECSAMSIKYLGQRFDIHTGGVDNIFPHHEDELAQSEAFTGQQFVNYWVHAQHLLADGLKMAKSTGNAYTLAEVEARGFEPLALRYFYTTALYRSRINFTFTALRAAQRSLERLRTRLVGLHESCQSFGTPAEVDQAQETTAGEYKAQFLQAMTDDLNVPRAMAVLWQMLRQPANRLNDRAKLALLLDWDQILGFGLAEYIESGTGRIERRIEAAQAALSPELAQQVAERHTARLKADFPTADALRSRIVQAGYKVMDTAAGTLVLPRRAYENFQTISTSSAGPDNLAEADRFEFSINLVGQNNRDDLARCIESLLKHNAGRRLELVVIDNGSTDETVNYLADLLKRQTAAPLAGNVVLQVIFADHNLGFAAGRNATVQASRGRLVVMLDTSIELNGDIWTELADLLSDQSVGIAGPYGLVTSDVREFAESAGPEVDAIEGYLLAFRRELWSQVGPLDEKFRFYRLMDIYLSFFFKAGGFRAVTTPQVAGRIIKHPHREWYSLTEEEQRTKSKKNYDLLRARWHHGQSLLVKNFDPANRWGHDGVGHLPGRHSHPAHELPPPGTPHRHKHQHWPDHDHEHTHYHDAVGQMVEAVGRSSTRRSNR